ncbi:MAG TPA: hypothetical protein VE970_13335 [Pseudolabrys sp.]|nr:hypothetical protein [Pseudolabrys sp.]
MTITLSQTEPGMTSQSLRNDAEHWRTRAEEVRMLASEEKDTTTKDALLRTADDYKHLARWVKDWAMRRLTKNRDT